MKWFCTKMSLIVIISVVWPWSRIIWNYIFLISNNFYSELNLIILWFIVHCVGQGHHNILILHKTLIYVNHGKDGTPHLSIITTFLDPSVSSFCLKKMCHNNLFLCKAMQSSWKYRLLHFATLWSLDQNM